MEGLLVGIDLTEEGIKQQLGINNWRELSKGKLFELLSLIEMNPKIDKEVYLEILKNIPQFIDAFKESMSVLKETLAQSNRASEESKKHYSRLADNLVQLLNEPNSTKEDKENIFNMLREINEYIKELDRRDREFFDNALKIGGVIAATILIIIGTITGVKVLRELPKTLLAMSK